MGSHQNDLNNVLVSFLNSPCEDLFRLVVFCLRLFSTAIFPIPYHIQIFVRIIVKPHWILTTFHPISSPQLSYCIILYYFLSGLSYVLYFISVISKNKRHSSPLTNSNSCLWRKWQPKTRSTVGRGRGEVGEAGEEALQEDTHVPTYSLLFLELARTCLLRPDF